jgi:long-chain fatty acid transport protein
MGATGTAYAGGYEAAWHNPAIASVTEAPKLTLGYSGGLFRLNASGSRVSSTPAKGTLIGASLPIPFGGVLARRVGLAFGFYEPTNVVVRGRVIYPEKTQFPLLDNRAQSVTVRAALGANVGYGVRLGVGFAALAQVEGAVVAATDATGRVGTRVEDQLVATYAPTFGLGVSRTLSGNVTWSMGLTYRGVLDARFAVIIDGTKLTSLPIPLFNIAGLAQYDPAQIATEIARRDDDSLIALQVVYKRWSAYPGPLEPTISCPDASSCGLTPPVIAWKDTATVRVGFERSLFRRRGITLVARGGGFFEMSPLPNSLPTSEAYGRPAAGVINVPTRYFDSDRIALTTGFGLALSRPLPPLSIDLYGQVHTLLSRSIRVVDPGGSTVNEATSDGHIQVFGITAGIAF